MYELTVDSHFDSAHCLVGYNGECSQYHGHTWHVSVTVESSVLDDLGMSIDFKKLRTVLDNVVGAYDHQMLNKLEDFKDVNPTAENIARTICKKFEEGLDDDSARVLSVTIVEGARNRLTYRPQQ